MASKIIKYLDKHGLGTLIGQIKKRTSSIYVVRGRAIYADAAYVEHAQAGDVGYETDITSVGVWQNVDGTWTKKTAFEEGDVFDIINAFTTDSDFREGAGHEVEEGMNIVVVNTGTTTAPVYKFDLFAGVLNLDQYQTKKLVNASDIEVFDNTEFAIAFPSVATVNQAAIETLTSDSFTGATAEADAKAQAAKAMYCPAVMAEDGADTVEGDVFRCVAAVAEDGTTPGTWNVTYTWVKLGNQLTVEGMLEFFGKVAPNTPITDEEIIDLFNE